MKKVGLMAVLSLFVTAILIAFAPKEDMLSLGSEMPVQELKMKNVDSKDYSLKELQGKNGTLVIFSCNTCPFVVGNGAKSEGWQNRYPELASLSNDLGVSFVLVNSNEAKRNAGDSMTDMKRQYKDQNYSGYYLLDVDSKVADAFGALTTPHVYLFDKDNKLVYRGAIDDNVNAAADVEKTYLKDALNNMSQGKEINPARTKQLGCSIRRV